MVLALCHPLIIVFDCENSFQPSDAFHELLPFLIIHMPSFLNITHSQPSTFVLQILPVDRSSILFRQLMVSSFSCILIPSSIFIRFPILPGELCLCYFHFQFLRWFVQVFTSFIIISIHSLFPNPTGGSINSFSSLHYISLNPF